MLLIQLADSKFVKQVKQSLELHGLFDKRIKIKNDDGKFLIPTSCKDEAELEEVIRKVGVDSYTIIHNDNDTNTEMDHHLDPLTQSLNKIINELSLTSQSSAIISKFSKRKWSIYPPLVLFTAGTNLTELNLPSTFYKQILLNQSTFFGRKDITHIAENAPIPESDRIRRPSDIIPLYGDFGSDPIDPSNPTEEDFQNAFWCSAIQNGIYQTWAPRYTMFSRGNITEKARVLETFHLQSPIKNTTVVDMYAGIGYFTFSYARNNPTRILCWEINPWSVEGLIRGAKGNNWSIRLIHLNEPYIPSPNDFIVIFLEDNNKALQRITNVNITNISHINLGLLPDSRLAWNDSLQLGLQSSTPTILHIHENIASSITNTWPNTVTQLLNNKVQFLYLELIKTFAPGIYHVCGDFKIK